MHRVLRRALVVAGVVIGCGGGSPPPPKTVRQVDVDAWQGAPLIELERHPLFASHHRFVQTLSDGTQMWTYQVCTSGYNDVYCGSRATTMRTAPGVANTSVDTRCSGGDYWKSCCHNEFNINWQEKKVLTFRPFGNCYTDCSVRPESRPCNESEKEAKKE